METPADTKGHTMGGQLLPVLPDATRRYDVRIRCKRAEIVVDAGPISDEVPTYLPPGWANTVHPEGNIYFYRVWPALRIVTECNIVNISLKEKINAWVAHIESLARGKGIEITAATELFLEMDGDTDCKYYLVDHSARTIFWLETDESDALGLSPVVSPSHMTLQLQAQYWTHVEAFCNHIGGLKVECVDELIPVFTHGLVDMLTSPYSTFPFDKASTEKFLNLLILSRDRIHEGHTVALVARLWSVIMGSRYENHHGQEQARLCLGQSILLDDTVREIQWTKTPIALLTFGTAAAFNTRLDALFVDEVLYGREWDAFIKYCMDNWQRSAVESTVLIFLHIFSVFLRVPPSLAYVSATLSVISALTAQLLMHRHAKLVDTQAALAHNYLTDVISPYFKFQATAAVFALPKVFAVWALIALLAQWIVALVQYTGGRQAVCVVVAGSCVLLAVYLATSRMRVLRPWGSIFRFGGEKAQCSMV